MNNTETVNVTLMSRTFSLKTTPENAKFLTQSADYIHEKMKEISRTTGNKAFEGLVVAAALNILAECDEKLRQARGAGQPTSASTSAHETGSVTAASNAVLAEYSAKIDQLLVS